MGIPKISLFAKECVFRKSYLPPALDYQSLGRKIGETRTWYAAIPALHRPHTESFWYLALRTC